MGLYVRETFENDTEGYIFGEGEPYETWADTPGTLFRSMQREYGRCTGKVYIDTKDGPPRQLGWVFVSTQQYEDSPEQKYLRRVWVEVYTEPPVREVTYTPGVTPWDVKA